MQCPARERSCGSVTVGVAAHWVPFLKMGKGCSPRGAFEESCRPCEKQESFKVLSLGPSVLFVDLLNT